MRRFVVPALLVALVVAARAPAARAGALGVELTSPPAGATIGGTVHVDAATQGPAASVTFDWSSSGGAPWTPIDTDSSPGNGFSAQWDTGSYSGPAVLRATVSDGASGTAEATESLTVDNVPPRLSADAAPTPFSPNGDGVKDRATLAVHVGEPATLDVTVQDAHGTDVWTLASGKAVQAGVTAIDWGGKILQQGSPVRAPDGSYAIVVRATDVAGNRSQAAAKVGVDTRAPSFRWRSVKPEPLTSTGSVHFTYAASDRSHALRLGYEVTDAWGGRAARVTGLARDRGRGTLSWNARYAGGGTVLNGAYTVRATVTDDAGNSRRSRALPFRVLRHVHATVWHRVDGAGRRVALTFDDCNDAHAWARELHVLAAHHVHATFFCLGINVNRYPNLARRTLAGGHTIGSHGWDHKNLPTLPYDQIRRRLVLDERAWWKHARSTPAPYFRPPYGNYDRTTLAAAGNTGYSRVIHWDVDPRDWERPGPSVIVHRVLSAVRPGSIVVMHVLPQTARALPAILKGLHRRHLQPVSVAELFHAAGYR